MKSENFKSKTTALKEVVIVDDQNLFACGFQNILEAIPGVRVSAILKSGKNIVDELLILKPQVLFLDLNIPGKNGIEVLALIRNIFPEMIIAILTMYEDQVLVNRVRQLKANAYLSKDASLHELKSVIFSYPSDDFYVSNSIDRTKHNQTDLPVDGFKDLALITNREREIIKLIAEGKNSEQISSSLFVSIETVKTHRKNIFRKLNLNKVPELVKFAYEYNLL